MGRLCHPPQSLSPFPAVPPLLPASEKPEDCPLGTQCEGEATLSRGSPHPVGRMRLAEGTLGSLTFPGDAQCSQSPQSCQTDRKYFCPGRCQVTQGKWREQPLGSGAGRAWLQNQCCPEHCKNSDESRREDRGLWQVEI